MALRIRDIPPFREGDGACGPAALYALLGGERPGEHRAALRKMGWRTPRGLSNQDAQAYLNNLGHFIRTETYAKGERLTVLRWVEAHRSKGPALLIAGHHWVATLGGLVVCGLHPTVQPVATYPRRRARVVEALFLNGGA